MESIREFVERTKGPLVPYVDSWYPWIYAHHYLRAEMSLLPAELGTRSNLSPDDAVELVRAWCGVTGEDAEESARSLADAYLRRWGVWSDRPERSEPETGGAPRVPGPEEEAAPVTPAAPARLPSRTTNSRSLPVRAG